MAPEATAATRSSWRPGESSEATTMPSCVRTMDPLTPTSRFSSLRISFMGPRGRVSSQCIHAGRSCPARVRLSLQHGINVSIQRRAYGVVAGVLAGHDGDDVAAGLDEVEAEAGGFE